MKTRKIGRILTVMFLSGGLMTGCQKKQTVVLPEKEQKKEATEIESKNKETQEISFDEELPKDYEGTLTMWGWDTEVGMKKRSLSSVAELLEVRDREKAGFTAPAKGLTLEKVLYSPLQKESETL